jgi:protein TonB
VVQKTAEPSQTENKTEQQVSPQSTQSSAVTDNKTETVTEQFTEASFKASYLHNPTQEYPAVAKSRGWEGKVMLKVKVSAKGLSESVEVEHSSGHEILDDSAIEAVKQWRFVPAKQGETPIASTVIVPIVFHLSED